MSEPQRVRAWAEALIALHLDSSWSFGFDNAKRRAGLCDYTHKRISVSRYLSAMHDDDEVHQTLLHEVAHAIVGSEARHGPVWKAAARELGYVGGTTHHGQTATDLAPWVGVCPRGHVVYRHRRPTRALSCAQCARRYDPQNAFTWTHRDITPGQRRAAATPR